MAKNILNDVIPSGRKTIRNLSLDNKVPIKISNEEKEEFIPEISPKKQKKSQKTGKRGGFSNLFFWIIAFVVLVVAVVLISELFSSVTVNITPKEETSEIDISMKAVKESQTGGLVFQSMTFSRDDSEVVEASSTQKVDRKASGRITILNTNSASQKLLDKTRFESPAGLIYRINSPVLVPGKTVKDGKTEPGSVDVVVYADSYGEKYNLGFTTFTIPGFKGDPRYKTITAISKTEISGGFSGYEKAVSKEVSNSAISKIRQRLAVDIVTEAKTQIPEGYVLFDNSYIVDYSDLPNTTQSESSVKINERAVFRGVIFDKTSLSNEIAKQTLKDYDGNNLYIKDIEKLLFNLKNKDLLENSNLSSIDFSLKGTGRFIWSVDTSKMKNDLIGIARSEYTSILSHYVNITKAEINIFPIWMLHFPTDSDSIKININI